MGVLRGGPPGMPRKAGSNAAPNVLPEAAGEQEPAVVKEGLLALHLHIRVPQKKLPRGRGAQLSLSTGKVKQQHADGFSFLGLRGMLQGLRVQPCEQDPAALVKLQRPALPREAGNTSPRSLAALTASLTAVMPQPPRCTSVLVTLLHRQCLAAKSYQERDRRGKKTPLRL